MFRRVHVFVVFALVCLVSASVRKPVRQQHNVSNEDQAHGAHSHRHAGKNSSQPEAVQASEEMEKVSPTGNETSVLGSTDDAADAVHSHDKHQEKHHGSDTSKLLMAYGVALVVMIACVSGMFYPLGATVAQPSVCSKPLACVLGSGTCAQFGIRKRGLLVIGACRWRRPVTVQAPRLSLIPKAMAPQPTGANEGASSSASSARPFASRPGHAAAAAPTQANMSAASSSGPTPAMPFRLTGDGRGNFAPVAQDPEDALSRERGAADDEELEHDPSERRPGGPVVDMLRQLGPQAWRQKWLGPAVLFSVSLLIQGGGLHIATHTYVLSMCELEDVRLGGDAGVSLAAEYSIRDRFQRWFLDEKGDGGDIAERLQPGFIRYFVDLIGVAFPLMFTIAAWRMRNPNLRLWTRALIVASMMAVVKGFLAFTTVMPDPAGWESCKERLFPWVMEHYRQPRASFTIFDVFFSLIQIILLWIQDVLFGMRYQQDLVCTKSVSGPGYLVAISALGLFEASRNYVRKWKPHFRAVFIAAFSAILTLFAICDSYLAVKYSEQHTADVVLALVLPLLLYSSPLVAVLTDRWLTLGCIVPVEVKEEYDTGDLVIPPCCVPMCWVHGRYYLFTAPASKAKEAQLRHEEELRILAREQDKVEEEYRKQQEEATRRILELDVEIDAAKKRAEDLEREQATEAQSRLQEAAREVQKMHEHRVADTLGKIDERCKADARRWECKANEELERLSKLAALIDEKRKRLHEASVRLAETETVVSTQSVFSLGDFRGAPDDFWKGIHKSFAAAGTASAPDPKTVADATAEAASGLEGIVDGGGQGAEEVVAAVEPNGNPESLPVIPADAWDAIHGKFPTAEEGASGGDGQDVEQAAVAAESSGNPISLPVMPADAWEAIHGKFPEARDGASPPEPAASNN